MSELLAGMFHKRARLDGQTEFTSCSEPIPASYNAVIVSSPSKGSSEHKTDTSRSQDSSDDRVSKSNGHTADTEEGEEGAHVPDYDEVLPGFKLDGGHLVPAMTTPVLSSSLSVGGNSSAAPVERPDKGGTNRLVTVRLRANSFLVEFQPLKQLLRYTFHIPGAPFSNAEPGEIMDKLIKENYADAMPVHDAHKYIYSSVLLPQGQFTVKLLQKPKRKSEMEYAVVIKLDGQFDGRCLAEKENQTFLQAVAVVLRENPRSQRFYMAGKGFLSKQEDMNERNIGGGIFASRGFCPSLRVTARGLALHVGLSVVPLYRNISLVDYLRETISCTEFEPLSLKDIHDVERHLRGLEIITTHVRTPNIYRVRRLSSQAAVDLSSVISMVGFVEHFKQKYDLDIRFKLWPCVDVSRNRAMPYYVPLEFCQICDGQRVRCSIYGSTELTRMQRCPPLAKRVEMIHDIMAKPDGPRGTHFTQFQITVAADMTEVTGRVLKPPLLKLGNGRHVRPRWDDRQWNLVSQVFNGKRIENWGIITFSWSNGNDTKQRSRVEKFYHLLVWKCIDMGVYMNEKPLVCDYDGMEKFGDYFQLREIIHNIQTQTKGELQILICVIENGLPAGYNYLKCICDMEVGLITQCCLLQNVIRCSYPDEMKASQCLAGLVLKINAKVGGSNVALHKNSLCKSPGSGHSDPVLIIGAHITVGWPSTAAVVGSMNWPDCNRYLAKIKFQMLRSGKRYQAGRIEQVGEMCEELLKDYLRINKQLPRKIVFFRRGALSEGCRTLCNFEVANLKKAINQLNLRCRPAISFILTWRAKESRLFPLEDQPRTRSGNVIPGTVVDTKIVHPSEFDFYLCSHYTHKGTAIPTCYHVIYDENAFTSDKLQKLVNNLCYTSGRCTKPVSLVAPIYYARLAARRGHQYAEAVSFELPETGSTLFSPTFELPEAIKDAMFFC
eukprot:PITA_04026